MTAAYAENKALRLAKDHNTYLYRGNEAAAADYRTALELLAYTAGRQGIQINYITDSNGYITID